jgi:hypothetical protein
VLKRQLSAEPLRGRQNTLAYAGRLVGDSTYEQKTTAQSQLTENNIRKLILHMTISTDGFISTGVRNVNPAARWSEDIQDHYSNLFDRAGGVVFGLWVPKTSSGGVDLAF